LHHAIKQKSLAIMPGFALAVATMHLTWGAGFLWGMLNPQ